MRSMLVFYSVSQRLLKIASESSCIILLKSFGPAHKFMSRPSLLYSSLTVRSIGSAIDVDAIRAIGIQCGLSSRAGILNSIRNNIPLALYPNVNNPPTTSSETGYTNSTVNSKNIGLDAYVRLDARMVEMYRLVKLNGNT